MSHFNSSKAGILKPNDISTSTSFFFFFFYVNSFVTINLLLAQTRMFPTFLFPNGSGQNKSEGDWILSAYNGSGT